MGLSMIGALIIIWGFNWPSMKIALEDMPPLWLAFARMLIAALCVFFYLIVTKNLRLPAKQDLPIILSVGLLQMAAFTAFSNFGLMHVSASRSAILAYTTPLWVIPMAVLWFKEPLPFLKIIGFLLGITGVFILFNPLSFNWHDYNVVIGNGMLILSAIAWAICMVHARFTKWHSTPLQLLPWQLLLAIIILFFFAMYFEPSPNIHWTPRLVGLLIYIGPVATALGYLLIIEVSRRLPSVTTSLCMLGVPIMGLFSSHFLLGDIISFNMILSMIFIIAGLFFVIKAKDTKGIQEVLD